MTTLTIKDFEKYFFDIIETSFFNYEKKGFFLVLKTLNISKKELIFYILEELKMQTNQNNDNIEITLKDLPKSTIINKITTLIETGDLKYLNATNEFSNYLNAIFTIIMQDLKKTDIIEYETSLNVYNNSIKLLRDRFNYDETKKNNIILIKEDFKGQQSFILKSNLKSDKFTPILQNLKKNNLINRNTTKDKFENIFLGVLISKEDKIDWTGTKHELKLFLKGLKPKLRIDSKIYNTAIRCFTINSTEIIKIEEISKSNESKGKLPKSQMIENIISLF